MWDKLKAVFRKTKIVTRIAGFLYSLYVFARRISKAMKQEDIEAKKNSILEAIGKLIESLPYDLPGLLSLEFKQENGGNTE